MGKARNRAAELGAEAVSVGVTDGERLDVVLRTGVGRPEIGTAAALSDIYARAGARGSDPVHLRVEHGAVTRALVRVGDVPGLGWRAWAPGPISVAPVTAVGAELDNALVRVEVDRVEGTFTLTDTCSGARATGLDRLVDGGDAGDTYNWSPPGGDVVVDQPEGVCVEVVEGGPLRAILEVTRVFAWPLDLVDDRRHGSRTVEVTTRVEVRAGERLVRLTTMFDNTCRDHRLRTWFPLPVRAATSTAECAFAVVERGTEAEGGPHETGMPTFPSRRFVSAGGLTVVHEGLLEYELVDDGAALALTLLRCVGLLSGTDLRTRPQPAGPPVPVEGAQMQGRRVLRYGVAVGSDDPYALADQAFLPLEVVVGSGHGGRPAEGSALTVTGAEVSALRRVDGVVELRVFNPTDRPTTVTLPGHRGSLLDLRGRPVEDFDGSFPLRPWGIATARLPD